MAWRPRAVLQCACAPEAALGLGDHQSRTGSHRGSRCRQFDRRGKRRVVVPDVADPAYRNRLTTGQPDILPHHGAGSHHAGPPAIATRCARAKSRSALSAS